MTVAIELKTLFQAGVHFGHLTRFRNPAMQPYIYGCHQKIHIIDLQKTLPLFQQGMNFLVETARRGGRILYCRYQNRPLSMDLGR